MNPLTGQASMAAMQEGKTYRLKITLREEDVRSLRIGDIVYLDGPFFTARSLFHIRAVEENILPPIEFDQMNIMLHSGPVVRRLDKGWEVISIEPTTSLRMEKYANRVIEMTGVRAIIGKSTMGLKTLEALARFGCVHLSKIGIYGSVLASKVSRVIDVHFFDDLGPIECTWVMEAGELGPFFVDMDTHGENFFSRIDSRARERLKQVYRRFSISDEFTYTSKGAHSP